MSDPILRWDDQRCKLSSVTSSDDLRPSLTAPWLRPTRKKGAWLMMATDSYAMAIVPVTVEDDDSLRERARNSGGSVYFPFRALRELETKKFAYAKLHSDGSVTVGDVTFHQPSFDRTPKVKGPFPTQPAGLPDPSKLTPKVEKPLEVAFNAKMLRSLSAGLGTERLRLTFDPSNNLAPVTVTPLGADEPRGLLMPINIVDK